MSLVESKLLDALSKLGNAQGTGLKAESIGKPPDDLVKAFQDALDNLSQEAGDAQTQNGESSLQAQDTQELSPSPAEKMPSLDSATSTSQAEAVQPTDTVQDPQQVSGITEPEQVQAANDIPRSQQVTASSETQSIDGKSSFTINQTESSQSVQGTNAVDSNMPKTDTPQDVMNELQSIVDSFTQKGASINPQELYRVQYLLGVMKTQSTTGMKVSQSVSQGMESILKQQG